MYLAEVVSYDQLESFKTATATLELSKDCHPTS